MSPDLTAEVAKVLAAHRQASGFDEVGDYFKYACTCPWSGHGDADHRAHVAAEVTNAVVTALGRADVVAKVKWRLDHYGPLDAKPFQYSRFESPAHAAIDGVRDALGLPEALGAGEVDRG